MIAGAGIEDQELAIITEGASVNDPSVARCGDLRAGTSRDREALLGAPGAVGCAEFLDSHSVDGKRELALGGRKRERGRKPPRIVQRRQSPPVSRLVLAGPGPARCGILLQPNDEVDRAVGLPCQRGRALPLGLECLLGVCLLLLALLDQQPQPLLLVAEP